MSFLPTLCLELCTILPEYLRIPLPTVYYLVQRGQLPAIQIGGRWRIKRSLLDTEVLKKEELEITIDILKETLPAKGVLEKKLQLDNNRQNLLIGEVEHIWKEIDQNDYAVLCKQMGGKPKWEPNL